MAKLNITADKIQSTTNMLKYDDTLTAEAWTAEGSNDKYPSAQAVANLVTTTTNAIIEACENASGKVEYPVGSVIIMGPDPANPYSTNDPNGKISGSWTLADKAFKTATGEMGKDPSTPHSQAATGLSVTKEVVIRNDHSLLLQLVLQVSSSKAITVTPGQDPTHLATLSINNYGLSSNELPFPIENVTAFSASPSTTTSSIIRCSLNADRKLVLNDVVTGGVVERKLEAGSSIYINIAIPVPYTAMKNDFCDKFYWKRTV
jgi:hypothetical protein